MLPPVTIRCNGPDTQLAEYP